MKVSYKNKLLLILSILILIPFLFNISLDVDEPFTMGLIRHNYAEIINLTSLDIHPPLYYFVLKGFLSITTFWTDNILIKIIFARLLSTFFSILTFVNLLSISNKLNIKTSKYTQLIFFLLLPLNLGLESQISNIRMYSLAMLLATWQVNLMISFIKTQKYKYLIWIIVPLTMSLYNNYFGGLISGLFLIIFIIDHLIHQEIKNALIIFLIGIISLLLFLPWIPFLHTQLQLTKYDTIMNYDTFIIFIKHLTLIIILFSLPFLFKNNFKFLNKNIKKILLYSYIIIAILLIIMSIVKPNALSIRYISPVLIIFMFLCLNICISKSIKLKHKQLISVLICILLFINFAKSIKLQMINNEIHTFSYIRELNTIKENNNKDINTKEYNFTDLFSNKAASSIYLYYLHKNISDKHYVNRYELLGNGNDKLFKNIFPNIKYPYKKHF